MSSPPLTPPSPSSIYLHTARYALHRSLSPPRDPLEYLYVPAVPNLELHSAAAEGNVGLVHYALTHGQPVNSVLHGVQPIHAAAAGGSVSALRMLIDRGADVNAPRLPRRYSNEKKRGAPSLGAAAANGHASIVQILLTCGAVPDKSDKLGQTPESLAEANGHEDVLHVLKVYDHLKRQDTASLADSASIASESYAGPSSDMPSPETSMLHLEDYRPSRKGKERAMSIASNRSDASGLIRLRKSLDGILGRRSRRNSIVMDDEDIPPVPPLPPTPPKIDVQQPTDVLPPESEHSRPVSPDNLPFPPSIASSSVYHSPAESPAASTIDLPIAPVPKEPEADLSRVFSGESQVSTVSGRSTIASIRSGLHLAPPREHRSSHSSRRPSLPSILEKAAHPGQAFRNALHRREHDQVRFTEHDESPRSVSGNSFFGRGRLRSNEPAISSGSSNGSQTLTGAQDKARKYMSRNAFIGLFRRSNSPPSRSPSPPKRRMESRPIDAQELEEGMERFKRASIELEGRERRSLDENREKGYVQEGPKSAPPIKTRFFEDLSGNPPALPNSVFIAPRSDGRKSPISPPSERPWNRPRKGSEVIAPSPLANEWARESSDSDSTAPIAIRRVKTDGAKESRGPSRLSQSTGPGSLRATKQRSATLPSLTPLIIPVGRVASSTRLMDLTLNDTDLRSGVLRRESEKKREEIEDDDDEDVFHDAVGEVVEGVGEGEVAGDGEAEAEADAEAEEEDLVSPVAIRNRFRGASVGSMTSQSSRLSTPPGSSMRFSASDDGSEKFIRARTASNRSDPADTRPRGKSVSSIATTASGSGLAFSSFNQSTSATSLTPPSTLSITLGSAFPPVPEDDVAHQIPPVPQRKYSTRAEAAKAIKQQEDDVLSLAQMPLSANSTRDLAAQLAAYGESHAMEQELAQIERRERRYARRKGKSKFEIPDDTGSEMSVSGSFVSAQSVPSASEVSSRRSGSVVSSIPPPMVNVEAPKSLPNIDSIYDRRAALYREKMQALTAVPALRPKDRRVTDNPQGPPAWLTGGAPIPVKRGPRSEISASLPVGSLAVQPAGLGIMAGASVPKALRKESFTSIRPAPPIADIVNTRYQGLVGPSRPATLQSVTSRTPSHRQSPTPGLAPVSIFSHRYAGPHDGGESDDSEGGEHKGYTMIENDWRGTKTSANDSEGLRKAKWGFKGPFGKKKM